MEGFRNLVARDSDDGASNEKIINLMIAILSLIFFSLLLATTLVLLRRLRRRQQMRAETLPQYNDVKRGNHQHLTIQTGNFGSAGEKGFGRTSVIVYRDGQPMLANPQSPPYSPDNVPEIHITFPDEQDEQGRPKSGRVVIVRVGETSVGLEPLHEEQLPAYEKGSNTQFYAIDLEKIGGLKEKGDYH